MIWKVNFQFIDSHSHFSFSSLSYQLKEINIITKGLPHLLVSPSPLVFFSSRKTSSLFWWCGSPLINQLASCLQVLHYGEWCSPPPLLLLGIWRTLLLPMVRSFLFILHSFFFFLCISSVLYSFTPKPLDMNFLPWQFINVYFPVFLSNYFHSCFWEFFILFDNLCL